MIKGSCLCGEIKFELSETPSSLSYCHCSRCRKSAGVYSAVVIGQAEHFKLLEGEDYIATHKAKGEGLHERKFCKECGTSLGDLITGSIYVVAASALDDDPKIRPMAHIHIASKPAWYDINDGIPVFEGDYIAETQK